MSENNDIIVSSLRNKIFRELSCHIGNDAIIVDAPYYKNIGDVLIWEGELQFLQDLGCKVLGSFSRHTFNFPQLNKDTVILYNGGGNIGDIYPEHIKFLKSVLKHYPDNKIIVFPQTVYYKDKKLMQKDFSLISKHHNIVFCSRDFNSYDRVKSLLGEGRTLCLPDMAFCIDISKYIEKSGINSKGMLHIVRNDCEKKKYVLEDSFGFSKCHHDLVQDWPTFVTRFDLSYLFNTVLDRMFRFLPIKGFIGPLWDKYAINHFRINMINVGISFISNFKSVKSERLHGAILSILLDKEVDIIDNSYGKNRDFYNSWLSSFSRVNLLKL